MEYKFIGMKFEGITDNPLQVWETTGYRIVGSDSAGWALSILDSNGEVGYGEYSTFIKVVIAANNLEIQELREHLDELRQDDD